MRFFRVNLPKKYLGIEHADELIQNACSMKVLQRRTRVDRPMALVRIFQINVKKLKRYEKEYFIRRAEEVEKETPLLRLEVRRRPCLFFSNRIRSDLVQGGEQAPNGSVSSFGVRK